MVNRVSPSRLEAQIAFVLELDRLKQVLRQTVLLDGSRQENSAEHSWHLAVMALVLAEHAAGPLDLCRVLQMLLVHDVVEIDAGDVFVYDASARAQQAEREHAAAERIFGLLPADQAEGLRALWAEFEARQTPEARFARALDRLQPLLHNWRTRGITWRRHGVSAPQVLAVNGVIADGAPALWAYAQRLIADAMSQGFLADGGAS